jgi:hypothetical protein
MGMAVPGAWSCADGLVVAAVSSRSYVGLDTTTLLLVISATIPNTPEPAYLPRPSEPAAVGADEGGRYRLVTHSGRLQ